MSYPVHERFYSFQGEGVHAGRAAFFIRTYGCPVRCPWCDSAGTWHAQHKPPTLPRMTATALALEAKATNAEFVVVTGGEPTIHDLTPLVTAVRELAGLPVHLETSGAFETDAPFDWITLSPKREEPPLLSMLTAASELKLIVDGPLAVAEWIERLEGIIGNCWPSHAWPTVWLHPEWSQRDNPVVLAQITEAVKTFKHPRLRAGWQLHKLFRADALDSRSAKPVPLGGDAAKGL